MKIERQWISRIGQLIGGQVVTQAANFLSAILLLWLLPTVEYAIFVLANLFLNIGNTGSDLNLSNALLTFGARIRGEREKLSPLFSSVTALRKRLYAATAVCIALLSAFLLKEHSQSLPASIALVALALSTVWHQQVLTMRTMVLNIHQDAAGILRSSSAGALARLAATAALCSYQPTGVSALLAVFLSVQISARVAGKASVKYVDETSKSDANLIKSVTAYVRPLMPAAIYYLVQGQFILFAISLLSTSQVVAEVGALSRFGQIFLILSVLNGFIVQPHFSRVKHREEYLRKTGLLMLIALTGFALVLTSAILAPDLWLKLLGPKYSHLTADVPIAFAGCIANYAFGLVFTLLLARGHTSGQNWYVALSLGTQIAFISILGLESTRQAMQLTLLTSTVGFMVQTILYIQMMKNWNSVVDSREKTNA